MKNKFKIFCIFGLVLAFSFAGNVNASDLNDTNNFKLYEVKEKEEVLVKNNEVIKFYNKDNIEILNTLIEEKEEEIRKIEEEKRLEEERIRQEEERIRQEQERIRLEEERRLEEQRRLEAERQAYLNSIPHDDSLGSSIASFASQFVGNPYVYGGTSLTQGADCSGFVMSVYANFGISLPRTTTGQASSGYGVSINDIMPGDIVSYGYNGYATHSALYIGNGMIVHAATPSDGIMFSSIYMMPIVTIRRIV